MKRRHFLKQIAAVSAVGITTNKASAKTGGDHRIALLQVSAIAGFQYYDGETVWKNIPPGAPLTLKRDKTNPHDRRAVEIWWKQHKLGYVPMRDNAAVAQLMDAGVPLEARLTRRIDAANPWERMRFAILIPLQGLPQWADAENQQPDAEDYLGKYSTEKAARPRLLSENTRRRWLSEGPFDVCARDESQLPGYVVYKS